MEGLFLGIVKPTAECLGLKRRITCPNKSYVIVVTLEAHANSQLPQAGGLRRSIYMHIWHTNYNLLFQHVGSNSTRCLNLVVATSLVQNVFKGIEIVCAAA